MDYYTPEAIAQRSIGILKADLSFIDTYEFRDGVGYRLTEGEIDAYRESLINELKALTQD